MIVLQRMKKGFMKISQQRKTFSGLQMSPTYLPTIGQTSNLQSHRPWITESLPLHTIFIMPYYSRNYSWKRDVTMNLSLQGRYNADLRINDVESKQYLGRLLEDIIHVDFDIITAHPLPSIHLTRMEFSSQKAS